MAIEETGSYIGDWSTTASANKPTDNPGKRSDGAAEIRQLKKIIFDTFPQADGPVTSTDTELNILDGVTSTTAELNILDGVTATAADLNKTSSLGTVYDKDTGTTSGTIPILGASGLPAVGASLLTNLPGINQIQTASYATAESTASTSFVDTSLSVSITPESANSTLLLLCYTHAYVEDTTSGTQVLTGSWAIRESTTEIVNGGLEGVFEYNLTKRIQSPMALIGFTASTGTSSRTFTMSHAAGSGDSVVSHYNNHTSFIIVLEIGG